MSLQNIVTHLAGLNGFAVINSAEIAYSDIDTSALMTNVISDIVDSEVFSVILPEDPVYPNSVYSLVSSKPQYLDSYKICQVDMYVVSFRSKSYSSMIEIQGEFIDALVASPHGFEITDKQVDYETDRECFRTDFEISLTMPTADPQGQSPALIVYLLNEAAVDSNADNTVNQRITSRYGVVYLTNINNLESLRLAVRDRLLGYQQSVYHHEMEFESGSPVGNEGGVRIWRDIYYDASYIKAA